MFIHFLITRFNIRITGAGPERMTSPEMPEDWLNQRMNLFLTFCVPSVLEQTNKEFTWIIYFDRSTPPSILAQLSFLKNKSPEIQIAFADDYQVMLRDISSRVKSAASPFVITSRLDNDDLISRTFIEIVQQSFLPEHNRIINFNSGYEYSTWDHVMKKWNNRPHNQFISLIEDVTKLSTGSIYSFPHWKAPQIGQVMNIAGQPHWMYLRHENNYSGQAVRAIPVFSKKNLDMFPEVIREAKLSFLHTMIYTIRWMPVIITSKSKRLFSSKKSS